MNPMFLEIIIGYSVDHVRALVLYKGNVIYTSKYFEMNLDRLITDLYEQACKDAIEWVSKEIQSWTY